MTYLFDGVGCAPIVTGEDGACHPPLSDYFAAAQSFSRVVDIAAAAEKP